MRLSLLLLATLAGITLAGCAGSQGRASYAGDSPARGTLEYETSRHGGAGAEIAQLFESSRIREARSDTSGAGRGLQGTEFYQVQIAPNPKQPSQLVNAGFARKLQEDRGQLFYYEFYDGSWRSIGKLMPGGELYRYTSNGESMLGKYELNTAVLRLYPAPAGYGFDSLAQDQNRVRMDNPDIAGLDPRGRGVYHTPHNSAPPVVVLTLYRHGEAALLSDSWERRRFNEAENLRLERERERRHGNIGQDETYGGMQYKDGNPVDSDGKPLRPGSAGSK